MQINKISKDLYEIEDFVTEAQQTQIIDFMSSLPEEQWWQYDSEDYKKGFWYGKQYHGERPPVFHEIDSQIRNLYESWLSLGPAAVQRYRNEDAMQSHRDYWLKDEPFYIRYGICIYYNEDYDGGELFYPELDIVHKPKARSLVMHGGNILHQTLPVKGDSYRYFSTCFISGSKEQPVILNQELFADIHEEDGSQYGPV